MKKIIAFILCILTLIPLLLSCGGEMPEKTPEPTTLEETPFLPTSEETPEAESVPYESTYCLIPYAKNIFDAEDGVKITVIRSKEEFESYAKPTKDEINSFLQWLLTEADESVFQTCMRFVSCFYEITQAISRYSTEQFFQDNVLLFIDHLGCPRDIVTTDVSVKQTNGKKELHINQLRIREFDFVGDDDSIRSVLVAMPSDLGVDFENDVIVNWDEVSGSQYRPLGGTIMYPYTTQHWGWKWELPE